MTADPHRTFHYPKAWCKPLYSGFVLKKTILFFGSPKPGAGMKHQQRRHSQEPVSDLDFDFILYITTYDNSENTRNVSFN